MKFKVGDRVVGTSGYMGKDLTGLSGTVIGYGACSSDPICVEWDRDVEGHNGGAHGLTGRDGHCWFVPENCIAKTAQPSICINPDDDYVMAVLAYDGKEYIAAAKISSYKLPDAAYRAALSKAWNLMDADRSPEPTTEAPKSEPVTLYCVKDDNPGVWLTKGKTYTVEDGEITFDDGFKGEFAGFGIDGYEGFIKRNPQWKDTLFPEVKRPAKVGEYIRAAVPHGLHDGRYEVGDILLATTDFTKTASQWEGVAVGFKNVARPERPLEHCVIKHGEYVVLEGYQPEPEKPKYYTGKVVCVEADKKYWGDNLTVGKAYKIDDGRFVWGDGTGGGGPLYTDVPNKNENFVHAKFIEFKGE